MMNLDRFSAGSAWDQVPLCRSYLLAIFDELFVDALEDGAERQWRFDWATGVLVDGQQELAGGWLRLASDRADSRSVFCDLKLRGVEVIRFVAGLDPTGDDAGRRASYPSSTRLPSTGQFLRQMAPDLPARDRAASEGCLAELYAAGTAERARATMAVFASGPTGTRFPASVERWRLNLDELGPFFAVAPRLRRIIRTADNCALQLNRSLRRAVDRHGSFSSWEAAQAFVSEALAKRHPRFFEAEPAASFQNCSARGIARSSTSGLHS